MKVILQSILYCCLLATVAHCAELEANSQLKKRLSMWLESRLRRDLAAVSVERTAESEHIVRPEDVRDSLLPHSRTDINVRTKRSKGCSLSTCTVHDLAHLLSQLNNKMKIGSAPMEKISPLGYGRRRRSLPPQRQAAEEEEDKLRLRRRITDSQVHKLTALLKRT